MSLVTPSYDMLLGACLSMGLAANGTYDELHKRLGDHLVKELFDGKHVTSRKSKRPPTSTDPRSKRRATAWHAFLRAEKELVQEAAGFHGRGAILKECARRWKLHKQVGTSSAPLMLAAPGSSASSSAGSSADSAAGDGLIKAIKELPVEEIHARLASYGLPIDPDHEINVAVLARAMMG